MIDRRVVRDLEDPGGELELGTVRVNGIQDLDKGFLCQVFRELAIPHHTENEREDRTLVAMNERTVRGLAALFGERDHILVRLVPKVRGALAHRGAVA